MNPFEIQIKEKLLKLPEKQQALFAFLVIDKLYPNYVAFQEKYNWGDSELLFDAITTVYSFIIDAGSISDAEIEDKLSRLNNVIPDMDDFGDLLSSFALNASTAVESTLTYLLDRNTDHIVDVVSFATDTIDFYVQAIENLDTSDPSLNIQIEHNSFMNQERLKQLEILDKLSQLQTNFITNDIIEQFKSEKPTIDLSLLPEFD